MATNSAWVYCECWGSSPRERTPGGARYLYDTGAVFDDFAHLVLHVLDTVGNSHGGSMPFIGQQVVIAVPTGDAQRGSAGVDARPRDVTCVDGIPQRDVGECGGADVSDGGEARQQGGASVPGSYERLARNGDRQPVIAEFGVKRDVSVRVNETGQHGFCRQVYNLRAGCGCWCIRPDAGDLAILYHNNLIDQRLAGANVEQFARADYGTGWRSRRLLGKGGSGHNQGPQ